MTQVTTPTALTLIPAGTAATLMSRLDFASLLLAKRGSAPITFIAHTMPRMRKTANPHFDAVKIAKTNGMVNFHYDSGVTRRLEKEGKDESEFKRGGSYHVPVLSNDGKLTPLCIHKEDAASVVGWATPDGQRPMQDNGKPKALKDCQVCEFHTTDITRFVAFGSAIPRLYLRFMYKKAETSYVNTNGETIDDKELEPFLYDRSTYANQGLDAPLIFLTYGLDSLQQATFDGQTFLLH